MLEREARIRAALGTCLDALRLAVREAEGSAVDPARWRWVAVGIASGLKAALVAALSGYETSRDVDVMDPSNPDRVAPLAVLLRRARSAEFLNEPERIDRPASSLKRVDRVATLRNQTLHGLGGDIPDSIAHDCAGTIGIIAHLMQDHPAFNPQDHAIITALVRDEISKLRRLLPQRG